MWTRAFATTRALLLAGSATLALIGCDGSGGPAAPSVTPPATAAPTAAGRHVVSLPGDGITLGGVLFRPNATDARPGVIVIHGWQTPGTNGAGVVESRAARYAEEGYVALAMSMRGWPASGGADDCGLRQPGDLVAAATWLRALPGVAPDRVGVVGFSQGGQVALLAAARDPRLRAVVAFYPVTDVARWKTTTTNTDIPGYITTTCEPGGVSARSPIGFADRIAAPVLLVHGDRDTRVPTEQSHLMLAALLAAGRQAELFLVPGAEHGFTASEEAVARPVVDAFLAARLR